MLILVTGWRHHPDEHAVYDALDALWRTCPSSDQFVVLHGDCPTGADNYASNWCTVRGVPQVRYPARDYGLWPWCGPKRNSVMVQHLKEADDTVRTVLAFPQPDWRTAKTCGTRDCIRKAEKAGFLPDIRELAVTS